MNEMFHPGISRLQHVTLAVGLVAGICCIAGVITQGHQFFISYLVSFIFWIGLSLGALCVAMIHHLTGGRWGNVSRRCWEAALMTLPLMALLFLPILFGAKEIYPWAQIPLAGDEILQKRAAYMALPAVFIRAVLALAIWTVMGWLLRRWSLDQDQRDDLMPTRRLRGLSGPGLVIYPLVATFAFVDWVMSIEARWYSTMFPVIICIGQILSAVAFAILFLAAFKKYGPLRAVLTQEHFHQLGNLLLTFVLFWTYISFGQFLIIYSGNLPHEIEWYLHRIGGSWKWLIGGIALFHFFLPFFLLLFRPLKRNLRPLVILAAIVLLARVADSFWLVQPTFFPGGIHFHWLDAATFLGMGGIWLAAFLKALSRHSLLLRNDPRLDYAIPHEP
jgi:hypothetical protein